MVNKDQQIQKEIPLGVKIISILYYIGAVLLIIFGILFLVGSGQIASKASELPLLGAISSSLFVIAGIAMIVIGILIFLLARGLWKLRPWARIVTIVLMCLAILSAIVSLIQGSPVSWSSTIVNAIIAGYLIFSKNVKTAFT